MPNVILSSVIANKPNNSGNAWVVLSWVLGLQRLGCRVLLLEQIHLSACVDDQGRPCSFRDSTNLRYFKQITEKYLPGAAALICSTGETWGMAFDDIRQVASEADILINVSGHLQEAALLAEIKQKVFVDLDPGFTQVWQAQGAPAAPLEGYDVYYSVGENIGRPDCEIPTCDIEWRPIRQPVLREHWQSHVAASAEAPFTTIASWRGAFGRLSYDDKEYGVKAHEFRRFLGVPNQVSDRFAVALEIYPGDHADRTRMLENGWELLDPQSSIADPDQFKSFVLQSKGEFSAAQGVYVHMNSGWFSDRSTRYLAAGRPVLVQETGFSRNLPTGEGLLTFRTSEEAVRCIEAVNDDYDRHCRAAHKIAEEYFDSDIVLTGLLEHACCSC